MKSHTMFTLQEGMQSVWKKRNIKEKGHSRKRNKGLEKEKQQEAQKLEWVRLNLFETEKELN